MTEIVVPGSRVANLRGMSHEARCKKKIMLEIIILFILAAMGFRLVYFSAVRGLT